MHLSLLSDGFFSDAINDAGRPATTSAAREHRDGLLRGLAVIGVMVLLVGLTLLASPFHPAAADTRCKVITGAAPQASVWWEASPTLSRQMLTQTTDGPRSFHASSESGTAVSLIALRQRFRSACR